MGNKKARQAGNKTISKGQGQTNISGKTKK
jgi:hypothetical protein